LERRQVTNFILFVLLSRFFSPFFSPFFVQPLGGESVDTDSLISLTAYVMIKAQVPTLYRTKMYCEDFMSEADRMGISGYFLCSFQTAFDYVCQLDSETISQNAELAFKVIHSLKNQNKNFSTSPWANHTHRSLDSAPSSEPETSMPIEPATLHSPSSPSSDVPSNGSVYEHAGTYPSLSSSAPFLSSTPSGSVVPPSTSPSSSKGVDLIQFLAEDELTN
jgi:hypothetical protein